MGEGFTLGDDDRTAPCGRRKGGRAPSRRVHVPSHANDSWSTRMEVALKPRGTHPLVPETSREPSPFIVRNLYTHFGHAESGSVDRRASSERMSDVSRTNRVGCSRRRQQPVADSVPNTHQRSSIHAESQAGISRRANLIQATCTTLASAL